MQWFYDWWNALNMLQQSFAVVAIPATVMLVLQTVLLLIGLGGHDADHGEMADDHSGLGDHGWDHDAHEFDHGAEHAFDHDDHDADDHDTHDPAHHAAGLRLFTVRGLVAFFAVGGWLGIALAETTLATAAVIAIAVAGGAAALLLTAWFIKWSLSLQDQGNLDLRGAVGKTAQVYIPIPAQGKRSGKVTMTLQERYVELSAVTTAKRNLRTDEMVKVTGVMNQNVLVVRPLDEE